MTNPGFSEAETTPTAPHPHLLIYPSTSGAPDFMALQVNGNSTCRVTPLQNKNSFKH